MKIKPLAQKAIKAIKEKKVTFFPRRFEKIALWWLKNFHDWNISRQVVWGIRIPAYKCKLKTQNSKLKTEEKWFVSVEPPKKCYICGECDFEQDSDTFDTWFSSAQWPFATLKSQISNLKSQNNFFNYFYPTSVMETGYDILPWWVCRMLMVGLYVTGKVPFKTVFL
ncbi:MAG: class I tRNA ligase family protein, partial [Microgenomates group bacterium]